MIPTTSSVNPIPYTIASKTPVSTNINYPSSLTVVRPFTPEEDTLLCKTILRYGEESWGQVSLSLKSWTPYECWVRWNEIKVKIYSDILSKDADFKERASQLYSFKVVDDPNVQKLCCIHGCKNEVKNRSRFSLRAKYKLKEGFVKKGWNKICTKHYFADLYKFKKKCRS